MNSKQGSKSEVRRKTEVIMKKSTTGARITNNFSKIDETPEESMTQFTTGTFQGNDNDKSLRTKTMISTIERKSSHYMEMETPNTPFSGLELRDRTS